MGSFVTKPKPKQDGTFWPCRKCKKIPKDATVDIYMENLGTKDQPNWISCEDMECFLSQGGHKPEPKSSSGRQSKTPEQLVEYRIAMSESAWKYAKQKAETEVPIEKREILGINESEYKIYITNRLRDRSILSSVFYYGIMGRGS